MSKPRSGAPKRVGVGLLAGALFVFGIALAPSAGATANVTVTRLAGQTRYGTAAAIAGHSEFNTPTTAIVATGENFPDALAASGLAGSKSPAPIILTQKDTYTSDAKSALGALKSKGVTAVTIVGGTLAVSESVKTAIEADGFTVTRTAGADRYATAAAIASAMGTIGTVGGNKTALIATGENFPDALAGGPAAYSDDLPILLVTRDSIPSSTSSAISSLGIKHAVILGGTAVVSDAVKLQLDAATGTASDRLAGINRYGTAAAVGTWEKGTLGYALTSVIAATGNNFPDALAAGPLGGELEAPIVLTSSCPQETIDFLTANSATIATIYLSGGTAVIDAATAACLEAAAEGGAVPGGTSVTGRPELQSAAIVSTSSIGSNPGTVVRYVFDETLTGAVPGQTGFKLYYFNGTSVSSANATVDSSNTKAVLATFSALTTASTLANLSLATVEAASVADLTSVTNPEGDAPLGGGSTTAAAAGVTSAPDLVSVSNPRASGSANTLVDFTFDEVAYNDTATGYQVVTVNGVDIECTFVAAPSGDTTFGNGTTKHTANCPNSDTTAGALTASNIARGYIDQDAVDDAATGTGNTNVLTAADLANSGNTSDPDLVSVSLDAAAKVGSTDVDQVTYTFDQPVTVNQTVDCANGATCAGVGFGVYTSTAGEVEGDDTDEAGIKDALRSTTNDTQVLVTFADGTLSNVVGAYILNGVVTAATGTANVNHPDEVGVTPLTSSFTNGTTDGPDLTGVVITQAKDPFGTVTGIRATYLFDEDVDLVVANVARLKLWAADPSTASFNCTSAIEDDNTGNESLDHTVTCVAWASGTIPTLNAAVLGTVDDAAVNEEGVTNTLNNPEGAAATSGGTGTPQS